MKLTIQEIAKLKSRPQEYYKSGDYPKYIVTQITDGITEFHEAKKDYYKLMDKMFNGKEDLYSDECLTYYMRLDGNMEEADDRFGILKNIINNLYDWDNLSRRKKEELINLAYDCKDYTEGRGYDSYDLIDKIYYENMKTDNGVSTKEYRETTTELLKPFRKLDNNLDRLIRKYSFNQNE